MNVTLVSKNTRDSYLVVVDRELYNIEIMHSGISIFNDVRFPVFGQVVQLRKVIEGVDKLGRVLELNFKLLLLTLLYPFVK